MLRALICLILSLTPGQAKSIVSNQVIFDSGSTWYPIIQSGIAIGSVDLTENYNLTFELQLGDGFVLASSVPLIGISSSWAQGSSAVNLPQVSFTNNIAAHLSFAVVKFSTNYGVDIVMTSYLASFLPPGSENIYTFGVEFSNSQITVSLDGSTLVIDAYDLAFGESDRIGS